MPPEAIGAALKTAQAASGLKTANGEQIATGIWTLVGVVTLSFAGMLFRFLPKWREIGNKERQADIERLTADIIRLEERLKESEQKIERAEKTAKEAETRANDAAASAVEQVHKSEMRLMTAVSAYQLMLNELLTARPDSVALQQAQSMMASVVSGDFGLGDGIKRLINVPAVTK